MYELEVTLNNQTTTLKTQFKSISELRQQLPHPIEIEAFGPQVFFSLMGKVSSVVLLLRDQKHIKIDQEKYDLRF